MVVLSPAAETVLLLDRIVLGHEVTRDEICLTREALVNLCFDHEATLLPPPPPYQDYNSGSNTRSHDPSSRFLKVLERMDSLCLSDGNLGLEHVSEGLGGLGLEDEEFKQSLKEMLMGRRIREACVESSGIFATVNEDQVQTIEPIINNSHEHQSYFVLGRSSEGFAQPGSVNDHTEIQATSVHATVKRTSLIMSSEVRRRALDLTDSLTSVSGRVLNDDERCPSRVSGYLAGNNVLFSGSTAYNSVTTPGDDPSSDRGRTLTSRSTLTLVDAVGSEIKKSDHKSVARRCSDNMLASDLKAERGVIAPRRSKSKNECVTDDHSSSKCASILGNVLSALSTGGRRTIARTISCSSVALKSNKDSEHCMHQEECVRKERSVICLNQELGISDKQNVVGKPTYLWASGDPNATDEWSNMITGSGLSPSLSVVKHDKVLSVISCVDEWTFDAFSLNEASGGRPLSTLAFALFKQSGIMRSLQLDEVKVARFLMQIEDGYRDNPYHGRMHAADVLQTLHAIATRGGLLQVMSEQRRQKALKAGSEAESTGVGEQQDALMLLGVYLSAVIHDYDHRGLTNAFLIEDEDSLALLYNDQSPMENHHVAAAFAVLHDDRNNFLDKLSRKARALLRDQIVSLVLGTDMKQHFSTTSQFNTKVCTNLRCLTDAASKVEHVVPPANPQATLLLLDDESQMMTWKIALKCADLGHLASSETVHRKWVLLLEEEMFRQGDLEKARGYAVSPLMDREKGGITKSQPGFFNIIVLPLFTTFVAALPAAEPLLCQVKQNLAMWIAEMTAGFVNAKPTMSSH